MKKLKKVYEIIKEKLSDKRTRAFTILCLYLIFFIIIVVFLRTAPKNNDIEIKKEAKTQNYNNIQKEYDYTYNIEINRSTGDLNFIFTGTKKENEQNEKIELYNNKTGQFEEVLDYEIINPLLLDLSAIISYVNNIENEFSTNYKNGTIQSNYLVPLNTIDKNLSVDQYIEINIYEKNDFITKVIIDATNIDKLSDNNVLNSKYTLEYKKIIDNN